jgi:hypothetical protein
MAVARPIAARRVPVRSAPLQTRPARGPPGILGPAAPAVADLRPRPRFAHGLEVCHWQLNLRVALARLHGNVRTHLAHQPRPLLVTGSWVSPLNIACHLAVCGGDSARQVLKVRSGLLLGQSLLRTMRATRHCGSLGHGRPPA